jgi:SAM-dependent MidA family methyltransferase
MGSVSPEFLAAWRSRAGDRGAVSFAEFMDLALYDPTAGYYRRDRERVGRKPGTDFYTATSVGPLFGELVAASAASLLAPADPGEFAFVEIGAEPGGGVLSGVGQGFRSYRVLRLGERLDLSGPSVVFSNELLDARPFRRFIRRAEGWRERGVACGPGGLSEVDLGGDPALPHGLRLPEASDEGARFDAPTGSVDFVEELAALPWTGLFLAFDYGKSWEELATSAPAGTARAYHRHRQEPDLLARPGEQDLTCHVCWDWIADALRRHRFEVGPVDSQEAFLLRHASGVLAATVEAEAGRPSARKAALLQLLHPAHLGQRFQVLSGLRRP